MNTPQERSFLESMARRGMLSIDLLSIDDKPVAFCYGFHYKHVYLYNTPGYDPEFAAYRVGNYLLLKQIERLCEDPTVRVIDFGMGDAQYKQVYSNRVTMESHVRIFAPARKGLCLNMARSLTLIVDDTITRILKKSNLYARIKRLVRDRLRNPQ